MSQPISNEVHNKVRENDFKSQQKLTENFTNAFQPEQSTIAVKDKILLNQPKKNQLTSYYDAQPYVVTEKNSLMITVENEKGSYTHDVSFAKKLIEIPTARHTQQHSA